MSDDIVDARARIHRQAKAHAEATVYSLTNNYLTADQKAGVEAVYQTSMGVFCYVFVIAAMLADQTFWAAYAIATAAGSIAWIATRVLPGRVFFYPSILFAGNLSTVIQLGFAGWAAFGTRYGVAGFTALQAIGIGSVLTAPMWLWAASSRKMNPKYAIAKRMFGVSFPFEREL